MQLSAVPNDRMLNVLAAQHRQLCHEQARMAAVLAEVGRCTGHPEPGEVSRLAAPGRYAPEVTRAALHWTRRSAEWEHDLAETVVHAMPALHTAWLAGTVDRPRVLVFDRYLTGLAREQITAICARAVPLAATRTTGQLAVLLRRMALAVDPAAAERWYRKGVRERNVVAVMGHDGTVTMSANGLPAEAACTRVQDLAAAAKRAGHPGLIGQIRCDLFLGLLDGRFHGMDADQVVATVIAQYRPDGSGSTATRPDGGTPPGTGSEGRRPGTGPSAARAGTGAAAGTETGTGVAMAGIEARVALSTLLGRDELPGEIPGLGLLSALAARARVAQQRRAQWRFAVTDDGPRRRSANGHGPAPWRNCGRCCAPPRGLRGSAATYVGRSAAAAPCGRRSAAAAAMWAAADPVLPPLRLRTRS